MPLDEIVELNKKFSDSFIGVRFNGTIKPFKVNSILRVSGTPVANGMLFTDGTWIPYKFKWVEESEDIIPHPQYGAINHYDYAVLALRAPTKQWKEGVTRQTVCLYAANTLLLDFLHQSSNGIFKSKYGVEDGVFLTNLYNPTYYSFQHSVNSVQCGARLVTAINSKFLVSLLPFSDDLFLFYYNQCVARVLDNTSIELKSDILILKDELEEFCNVHVN